MSFYTKIYLYMVLYGKDKGILVIFNFKDVVSDNRGSTV